MIRSTACSLLLGLALTFASAHAAAQPGGDKPAAEAVFRAARELMDAGDHAAACAMFEKSLTLYESASAAINLARCYAKTDRLAAALTTLDRAVELNAKTVDEARRAELAALAERARREIEPRVPYIRVLVSPAISGTVVRRNGIEVPAPMLGSPIPVDPGTYEVRVAAPGYPEVVKSSTVDEGQTVVVEIRLARPDEAVPRPAREPDPPPPAESAGTELPIWPWPVGAAGLAALGVAVGFAVDFAETQEDLDALCPEGRCPRNQATAAEDLTGRWNRDVAFIAAGGALGIGLLVTAGLGLALDAGPDTPRVSVGLDGIHATISF
jgi:hypothetical protein